MHHVARCERGQTTAEYAVILSVLTVLVIAAFGLFASSLADKIEYVAGILF